MPHGSRFLVSLVDHNNKITCNPTKEPELKKCTIQEKTSDKSLLDVEDSIQRMIPFVKEVMSALSSSTSSSSSASASTSAFTNTSDSRKYDNQRIINFLLHVKLNVDSISSTFLETSGLPDLLKTMKRVFKRVVDYSDCLTLCKNVYQILKLKYKKIR